MASSDSFLRVLRCFRCRHRKKETAAVRKMPPSEQATALPTIAPMLRPPLLDLGGDDVDPALDVPCDCDALLMDWIALVLADLEDANELDFDVDDVEDGQVVEEAVLELDGAACCVRSHCSCGRRDARCACGTSQWPLQS
jgi:hypothetical protein